MAFNQLSYQTLNKDGTPNLLDTKYRNIRWLLPVYQSVVVNARYESNLPTLSYEIYGDVSLWWVLLAFNGLTDPIEDVKPGVVLQFPEYSKLIAFLESQESNSSDELVI